jgi:hypothetical protein
MPRPPRTRARVGHAPRIRASRLLLRCLVAMLAGAVISVVIAQAGALGRTQDRSDRVAMWRAFEEVAHARNYCMAQFTTGITDRWDASWTPWAPSKWIDSPTPVDDELRCMTPRWSRWLIPGEFDRHTRITNACFAIEAGWPLRCLRGEALYGLEPPNPPGTPPSAFTKASGKRTRFEFMRGLVRIDELPRAPTRSMHLARHLPWHVLPVGLAGNTVLYGSAVMLGWWASTRAWHGVMSRTRRRRSCCQGCGHALLPAQQRCPECGVKRPRRVTSALKTDEGT